MTIGWGILGAAGIAKKQFLPAIKQVANAEIRAIASRSKSKAQSFANDFDIPKIYNTYDSLLNDPDIDAIYIPLPNDQHLETTKQALSAGKHVLCEKPITLQADEIHEIQSAAKAADKWAIEGFMVAYHPQWDQVRHWIESKAIGKIQRIEGCFTYYLDDPNNIRNREDGGALRDIGLYPIFLTRWITRSEPQRVLGRSFYDQSAKADIQTTAWLDFADFDLSIFVSARANRSETLTIYGTKGRIEIPKSYNPPNSGEQKIFLYKENEIAETKTYQDVCQFARQIESVSKVFAGEGEPIVSLQNSYANQAILDAIRLSAQHDQWQTLP
ncbi:MAG: Gfo/Idh/MocA family oxidoreductase [Cohaesibacter sp.]|nr:Gfo/Idh/MocA family oxidoreductase [Cohaesibacter sp.]MCV6602101.1 Gfo/Idh/MocA family oxidoreductase [Cohaesibacter sp.]